MFEKLIFTDENGNDEEFYVLEQTRMNGTDYLLISDAIDEDNESAALIIKDVSRPEDTEAVYELVENEDELKALSQIFNELLDDIDVE